MYVLCSRRLWAFDNSNVILMNQVMPHAQAGLLSRDAVTNARALLRYALPVDEQKAKPIRQIQVRPSDEMQQDLASSIQIRID